MNQNGSSVSDRHPCSLGLGGKLQITHKRLNVGSKEMFPSCSHTPGATTGGGVDLSNLAASTDVNFRISGLLQTTCRGGLNVCVCVCENAGCTLQSGVTPQSSGQYSGSSISSMVSRDVHMGQNGRSSQSFQQDADVRLQFGVAQRQGLQRLHAGVM